MWGMVGRRIGFGASLYVRHSIKWIHPAVSASRFNLPPALLSPCLREFNTFFQKDSPIRAWERSFSSVSGNYSGSPQELEISKLGLSNDLEASLTSGLKKRNGSEVTRIHINHLKPIQSVVFTPAMEGRHIIAQASEGAGKTLAYGIPIINKISKLIYENRLNDRPPRQVNPLALVLSPNRRLALNVRKVFHQAARELRTVCVDGDRHLGVYVDHYWHMCIETCLHNGCDIVVGSPGRVAEVLEEKQLSLSEVKFVVLDDVDRMDDEGSDKEVEDILNSVPPEAQTMIFGASLPKWISRLKEKHLKNPLEEEELNLDKYRKEEGAFLFNVCISLNHWLYNFPGN
ncbi:hypothetical protein IFM89_015226 [Coptis chinensis]|uniref:Helicase ATP-binding domain-containing protein n=1 Tax=Coptis chinensis TaxID=261450 RepID=A0A835H689_9MAGN|nr:hypothetical protein IFM89_015226 [Coptis chinensis]